MDKLCIDFQKKFVSKLIYDDSIFASIDPSVKLHDETKGNLLSSAASCLNVLGAQAHKPQELMEFLNSFGLNIETILEFPLGANVEGRVYNDRGFAIFEWIGPQVSPLNEVGGGRGQNRTSVDAFIIAQIDGKITQILIEWKFTEGKSRPLTMMKFSGTAGLERLRRYSNILAKWRGTDAFPFNFERDKGLGLADFSVDHLYQLLRMTLLAKTTLEIQIGDYKIEDYRIVHLSHSANYQIDILYDKYLVYSPGLQEYTGKRLYDAWSDILSGPEKAKFIGGHWDTAIQVIKDDRLRQYLNKRY